jgi:hypothetical protein
MAENTNSELEQQILEAAKPTGSKPEIEAIFRCKFSNGSSVSRKVLFKRV